MVPSPEMVEAGDALGVDASRDAHLLGTLPAGLDLRVVVDVGAALQNAVLLHQQVRRPA